MTPLDTKALSAEVAGVVNRAVTPLLERVATIETKLLPLVDVRDRVIAVETKCSASLPYAPDPSIESRLMEAFEKLATLEWALQRASAHESMIADLKARLAAAEATADQYAELSKLAKELIERVAVMEVKAASPNTLEPILQGMTARLQVLEQRVIEDPSRKDCAELRERVAVVESRQPVPGPPGPQGAPGEPGRNGTLDGLKANYDGERTITLSLKDGTPIEGGELVLPIVIDRGVYTEGRQYQKGDAVTWGGSLHIAQMATTAKPEEGARGWRLAVKRGRDGKDAPVGAAR